MAVSTAITTLKYSATQGGSYVKLVDIISYPDLGSTPSKLDTTDLSATKYKTSILGLQEIPDLTFEANYDETAYNTISAITTSQWFHLEMGTAGADGIFEWKGQVQCYVNGAGVDEVRKMTIVLSAETPITLL
jgi:hypothetical protein